MQLEDHFIPSSLKFVVSNLKHIVPTQLVSDNYPLWKSQILKIFKANGFDKFLDSTIPPPDPVIHPADGSNANNNAGSKWILIDQNLAAALCSTISPSVLPHVSNLATTAEIWSVLEHRFQATNRSKVIQLKNTLHHISLKNQTMTQYLSEIKSLVDQITAAGSTVDDEDVVLYILQGLPNSYQSFKTSIRTMLHPVSLDSLYSLLISEEIHVSSDVAKETALQESKMAFYTYRGGRGRRSRGRQQSSGNEHPPRPNENTQVSCQICLKRGHSAPNCWHRLNTQYIPSTSSQSKKALLTTNDNASSSWFLDSGASSHLSNSLENLNIANPYHGHESVTVGDGRSVNISHSGDGLLPTPSRKLVLSQIFHSPSFQFNLISISQLIKDNRISIIFDKFGFTIKDSTTHQVLLQGPCKNGLYAIPATTKRTTTHALSAAAGLTSIWHQRLGHPNSRTTASISASNPHLQINRKLFSCSICNAAKCHKLVFPKSIHRSKRILELIHTDVWGPAPVVSVHGFRYYVLFLDDFSHFVWIFPMRTKDEVTNIFISFKTCIEKFTSQSIRMLRSDGGTEFINDKLRQFLVTHGINHQISCPYTPEQNGAAERKHRHLIETTRTLLSTASVPYIYWPEAVATAAYLINRMPSKTIHNCTPFELIYHTKPDYSNLRVFGCECFPLLPSHKRHKFQPKATSSIFLGYSDQHKGYKCLDSQTKRIIISRHTTFIEDSFPFSKQSCSPPISVNPDIPPALLLPNSVLIPSSHQSSNKNQTLPNVSSIPVTQNSSPLPTSSCPVFNDSITIPAPVHHLMVTRMRTGSLKPIQRMNLTHHTTVSNLSFTPTCYTEAIKYPEWRSAMAAEFFALQRQGTWSLIPRPSSNPVIGCKWTYRLKYHADGSIAKHKARLVALGNNQEFGLDYTETFSPVAKLPTIRILLTVAIHHQWSVQQLDVANAFLHGILPEKVFMTQPKGFEDASHPDYVCLLHKAIYGLKQAPRQWYNTLTEHLLSLGFAHSKADPSLFLYNSNGILLFLLIYVDDILITGNDNNTISAMIHKLSKKFDMKKLGEVNEFLGIQIKRMPNCFFLSQTPYALSILQQAQMSDCKPLSNPNCTRLPDNIPMDPEFSDPILYRRIIGSLQYLTLTRPDLAFSINQLSQNMHNPMPSHFYMLQRTLRYIKGTLEFGIPIIKSNLLLHSYSDADWAGDPHTRKSISGYCSFLGQNLISWTVKKQSTVARSSTESEYRSLAALTADVIWLRRILAEFGISPDQPTDMHCDNTSAIALANNPVFHARTKHIEIDQKFVRDQIINNNIRLLPISTIDQVADILTKPLSTKRFHQLRSKMTVVQEPSFCRGILEQNSK
ncbi:Retrovirus-related Pol polyprotein from transposon TNT 1-94 [Dendrobium catenatum]|uniref:Retrovirus-related Pol polyprotein from transposon TNT 1-94 n=1 Tax=Dendrobium catenatum TaxID=906689 RepID=A0A2I0WYR7_9ASPA|nr:Retrovirus-related Pol polyprotein from transposon TNT 1-94 [Dendrobium catenatum]